MRWNFIKQAPRAEAGIYLADKVAAIVASIVLVVMMLLTVGDVVGRYCFNRPIRGTWEVVGLLLVCSGTWGWGYCQMTKGHIRVDIILERLPRWAQRFITSLSYLIGFVGFSLVSWRLFVMAKSYYSFTRGGVTEILHIPYYPFIVALGISAGLLALTVLIHLFRSILEVAHK